MKYEVSANVCSIAGAVDGTQASIRRRSLLCARSGVRLGPVQ